MVMLFKLSNLIILNPSRPSSGRTEKTKLNFYFHTSLWCLKRFYEGLKGLHRTFRGTAKKRENTNFKLIFISIQLSEMQGSLRVKKPFSREKALTLFEKAPS